MCRQAIPAGSLHVLILLVMRKGLPTPMGSASLRRPQASPSANFRPYYSVSAVLARRPSPNCACRDTGWEERAGRKVQAQGVLDEARRNRELEGLRRFAKRMGIDSAILDRALKGRTKPGPLTLAKLQAPLAEEF